MAAFDLKGLGVAMITPFRQDKSVDFNALENIIEHLVKSKVDYIVVLGTTGETPLCFLKRNRRYVVLLSKKFVREYLLFSDSEATIQCLWSEN